MMTAAALPEDKRKLAGNGNNGLIRQESSTEMWYGSGRSPEAEEIATFHWPNQQRMPDPLETPMPWTLTRSISPPEKEQSTCRTTSASSVTKEDATRPSIRDILEEEENPCNKKHTHHGGPQKLEKLKGIHGSTIS